MVGKSSGVTTPRRVPVGPDGARSVVQCGLIHAFVVQTPVVGGLMKFGPR